MSNKLAFVPGSEWSNHIRAIYENLFAENDIQVSAISVQATGAVIVTTDESSYNAMLHTQGLDILSDLSDKGNVMVLADEADVYATENDPFAERGKGGSSGSSRKLSEEELAERKRRAEIRKRLEARRESYKQSWIEENIEVEDE